MLDVAPATAIDPTTEERTLLLAMEGSREAYGDLVAAYMSRAYAAAFALTGRREDALDVCQDAFVKAWRALPRFEVGRPFHPWLYRIIRNLCYDLLRRRRLRPRDGLAEEAIHAGPGPEAFARRAEAKDEVWRALARLCERDREILVLRHFEHLAYREIADVLGIPQGTVMSRLFTARQRLRAELSHLEE